MLKHLLENKSGLRVAVIVNDMASVNIDAELVRRAGKGAVRHVEEKLVELSNGCICCTLRDDLLQEVAALAKADKYDYLVIESTGISEPLQVAETFTFDTGSDGSLSNLARLDCMVTVLDANNFWRDWKSNEKLRDRGEEAGPEDERTIIDLMTEQVEFANVILVNKTDLVEAKVLSEVDGILRRLNPSATVIRTQHSSVDPKQVLGTGKFDFEEAKKAPGWLQELQGEHVPESEEYGVSSFIFRARKPFHPARLHASVAAGTAAADGSAAADAKTFSCVVRSKGFVWLATRNAHNGIWGHAGVQVEIHRGSKWWAEHGQEGKFWPADKDVRQHVVSLWEDGIGDRAQELVVIGLHMDHDAVRAVLDRCLLTEEEFAQGADEWAKLDDPWPEWKEEEDEPAPELIATADLPEDEVEVDEDASSAYTYTDTETEDEGDANKNDEDE